MERSSNQQSGIDPRDVESRRDLARYLDQSLLGEYVVLTETEEFTQVSTFVKSYLIEAHRDNTPELAQSLRPVFPEVTTLKEPSLLLAFDKKSNAYFIDVLDPRFVVFHSIANTTDTDSVMSKLADGAVRGFDRAWMPTEFLVAARRGQMTGFKFGFERFVQGLSEPEGDLLPATTGQDSTRRARFRMAVSDDVTAESDYDEIQDASMFSGRKALEHIQFAATVNDGGNSGYISNRVYADGKIIGNGTSIGSHLVTVDGALSLYSSLISTIELHALQWSRSNNGHVHQGEPFMIRFPNDIDIVDIAEFVKSIIRPTKPFRLLGIPHHATDDRVDVEVVDLHTGDPLSIEVTRHWMRIYLPSHSCGNIVARLYSNLQHAMHSGIELVTGDGEIPFTKRSREVWSETLRT